MFLLLVFRMFFGFDFSRDDFKISLSTTDKDVTNISKWYFDYIDLQNYLEGELTSITSKCADSKDASDSCKTALKKTLYMDVAFSKLEKIGRIIITDPSYSSSTDTTSKTSLIDRLDSIKAKSYDPLKIIISGTVLHNRLLKQKFDLTNVLGEINSGLKDATGHESSESLFNTQAAFKVLSQTTLNEDTFFAVLDLSAEEDQKTKYDEFLKKYKTEDPDVATPSSGTTGKDKKSIFNPSSKKTGASNFSGSNGTAATDKTANPNNVFVNPNETNKTNQTQDDSGSGSFGGFGSMGSNRLSDSDDRKERTKKRELKTFLQNSLRGIAGGRSSMSSNLSPRSTRGPRTAPNFAKTGAAASDSASKNAGYSNNYYSDDAKYSSKNKNNSYNESNNPYLKGSKSEDSYNTEDNKQLSNEYSASISKLMDEAKIASILGDTNKVIMGRYSDIFEVQSAVYQKLYQDGSIAESSQEIIENQAKGQMF